MFAQARELARRVLAVNPNDAFIQMDLAWISAVLGATEEAHSLIERARESVPDDPYVHYIDALILNLTGEMDRALAALALAVENGYSTKMLAADPNFLNLRGNTRFDAVMALQ